jgi:peptidyl-prolyl cis-trans isomerase SurA
MTMFRFFTIFFCALLVQPVAAVQSSLDSIIVVVDESVITERELRNRITLIRDDFSRANRKLPSVEVLQRQVLEALINDSILLQEANRRGIIITDSQLNQTMLRLAQKKQLSLSDYRQALIADGLDYDKYRETVRKELTMSTLSRQYSQRNATVSETEIDDFIKLTNRDSAEFEYQLSHILIALPDAASPDEIDAALKLASEINTELDNGAEFDQLANIFSAGNNALEGGDLGWRKKAEIPSLFTAQVLLMEPGDHAGPIRSPSGFHIVYLEQRRDLEQVISKQTRSRHILIKPNELISEDDARDRLLEFRSRILAGEDFGKLAKLYSIDYGSGAEGGDIGWMDPGKTVREYESVTDSLPEGELSQPIRSQFGWHLIEVTGRRTVDETEQTKREKIYSQLLQQKQREVFDLWRRRLRDEAYIVFPNKPDA